MSLIKSLYVFTLVLSSKLQLFCCYFGGFTKNIRCSPRLSLTRFNIFYNLKNFNFHFFEFCNNRSGSQQFLFSNSLQLVSAWDCAGLMCCLVRCVSLSKLLSVCLPFHLLFSVVSLSSLSYCQCQATTLCSPEGTQISRESGVI